ncbi:hypothetical protein WOLCODRAFT_139978 [Wolfiporia cocos MD-104 SS10]|uniref:Uncharacterized protein n=1 Tax=Wolfiporia cocos (strain MD-104) TaxID=742152 RepID=A0A2H3JHX6_WOLCO|nr:hypothetical protein WOLCODRAFT_139978 [Wolfiporia cocos MD-104 SS10]
MARRGRSSGAVRASVEQERPYGSPSLACTLHWQAWCGAQAGSRAHMPTLLRMQVLIAPDRRDHHRRVALGGMRVAPNAEWSAPSAIQKEGRLRLHVFRPF